ncbi:hypothetical protein Tcan_00091 [Toxocara canis]|uniref:Uncharacterized protein n=1 Tax=Toxocara canis TaxID=6265 RepID=A0A0B2V876_TOXCA|nr:hypothetical protein Tcan_00091 [Toxocara canis]
MPLVHSEHQQVLPMAGPNGANVPRQRCLWLEQLVAEMSVAQVSNSRSANGSNVQWQKCQCLKYSVAEVPAAQINPCQKRVDNVTVVEIVLRNQISQNDRRITSTRTALPDWLKKPSLPTFSQESECASRTAHLIHRTNVLSRLIYTPKNQLPAKISL